MAIWCKFYHHILASYSLEFHFDLINLSCDTSLFPSLKHSLSHLISTVTYVPSSPGVLITVPWNFWGPGSLVELKWCHYIMVEDDSHLKLTPVSTLDIYWKMFEHIDMLSIGIWQYPLIVIPTLLGSYLGVWVTCGVKMMSLCHGWGSQPTQTIFPTYTLELYNMFKNIDMLSMGIWQ